MTGVLAAIVVAWLAAGLLWRLSDGDPYEEIGRDGIAAPEPARETTAARDLDVAELLAARDGMRARRGAPPAGPPRPEPLDPGLAAEVRQLVEADNARRARRGEPLLDVEAETARRLRALSR
jgi:hypothetical protein